MLTRFTRLTLCLILLSGPAVAQTYPPGAIVPNLQALTTPALENFEYFGEGRPGVVITIAPNADRVLEVRVEQTGFLDDSVAGGRSVYTVEHVAEGGWQILTSTYHQMCYRGENRDWTTQPCP